MAGPERAAHALRAQVFIAAVSAAIALITPGPAQAAPNLRVAISNEFSVDPWITGLIGPSPLASATITEVPESVCWLATGALRPGLGPVRRLLWFGLSVGNVGDDSWEPASPPMALSCSGTYEVGGVAEVTIYGVGGIAASRLLPMQYPFGWIRFGDAAGEETHHWSRPGIAPGWATWQQEFVEITGLADGEYDLEVSVDPLGIYGQFSQVRVRLKIDGFDARILLR